MTNAELLAAVRDHKITPEDAAKMIHTPGPAQPLRCKVSGKGGVSVYGLNAKWPVTLYDEQWDRLEQFMPTIKAFRAEHADKLAHKG